MKKQMLITLMTLGLLCTLSGCGSRSGEMDSSAPQESQPSESSEVVHGDFDARTYIELLCVGDLSLLTENYSYTDEMQKVLDSQASFSDIRKSLEPLGTFQSTEAPIVSQNGDYTIYVVPCSFEAQKLSLVISLDSEQRIAGLITAPYTSGSDTPSEDTPSGIIETELNLPVADHEGWQLPGTLTLPEGDGPFPALVLVHGSGPNDRDETLYENKPFRDIAQALAQKGIAVYRYDKRTYVYGQEMASDTTLTLDAETIDDAAAAAVLMKNQEDIDPNRIFILGHSLGGQALPRIHQSLGTMENPAAGYIFLAAPARNLADLMREQYDFLYSLSPTLTESQKTEKENIYAQLEQLSHLDTMKDTDAVMGAYVSYWKDLLAYDPLQMAREMDAPCLILQGEEDYQVTMEDFNLWKDAFGEDENWSFHSYPGLTHLFTPGKKSDGSASYMAKQSVDTQVISDIEEFINLY